MFALCRVVKKNDQTQKSGDFHGEGKGKQVGNSSRNGDFTSTAISNEPLSISDNVPSQASHAYNESNYSSPITSPYESTRPADFELSSMGTNPTDFWVSPDLILDSSKVFFCSLQCRKR